MTSATAATAVRDPVPRLVSTSGGGSGLPYAMWRPQMQTFLMHHGIEERDYTQEIPQWEDLLKVVRADAVAREQAAFALLLKGGAGASSSNAEKREAAPDDQQLAAKQLAIGAIGRAKKAFGFLYAALPTDLKLLVAGVPQGYAYGIWVLLETKFRNTEQDNVGDLWAQFVNLAQEPEEKFDEYKARADAVLALLTHAKETPPAGLYSYVLLWKLQPRYEQAVLALKASGQIKDPAKIDWASVVGFMSNHERSQGRYDDTLREGHGEGGPRAFATRSRGQAQTQANGSNYECYNCGETGHIARNCEQERRRPRRDKKPETRGANRDRRTVQQDEPADRSSSEEDDETSRDAQRRHKREPGGERANAVRSHVADRQAGDRGKGGQPYAQESEDEKATFSCSY